MVNLVAQGISKVIGSLTIFSGISFEVRDGDVLAVVGPSGSGKTTLLHILASYDRPSSGVLSYDGQDLSRCDEKVLATYRSRVGFIHQEPLLFGALSAKDNILLPFMAEPKAALKDGEKEAVALAEKLRIGGILNRRAAVLSTGEKKRVEVVRALLRRPSIILAGEPTANLDMESSDLVIDALRWAVQASGAPLVLSAHRDQRLLDMARARSDLLNFK